MAFSVIAVHESGLLDPAISRQIFTHWMLGRLPTLLSATFVLLQINFHLATDAGLARRLLTGGQTLEYSLACVLACVLAWMWFFLSVLFGSWLGMMQSLSGYGHAVWESFWVDFQYPFIIHAGLRSLLLAVCLSMLAFVEIHFLQDKQDSPQQTISRTMLLGVFLIISIEIADFFWMIY